MPRTVSCPTCKKVTPYEGNPYRPFCSERCQKIDLGTWAVGGFKIPGKALDIEEDNVPTGEIEDSEEPS